MLSRSPSLILLCTSHHCIHLLCEPVLELAPFHTCQELGDRDRSRMRRRRAARSAAGTFIKFSTKQGGNVVRVQRELSVIKF